jgi:hypothetical protein
VVSALKLAAAVQARAASTPEQLQAPSPAREVVLEGWRRRNAALDALFYDVRRVDDDEARRIGPRLAAEGAILSVPPSGGPPLNLYTSTETFAAEAPPPRTLVVAGVGSSALGAAAFARNVADAIEAPVAAVVSGYGLSDLLTEALGGFFWFGALNGMRHAFESLDRGTEPAVVETPAGARGLAGLSKDTARVLELLSDPRFEFDLLVGHSKGNLVISEALYALTEAQPERAQRLGETVRIVTVSAVVAMPPAFRKVIDVIGGLDGFGALNSRWSLRPDRVVLGAWHHTNTELPAHLPVARELRRALAL